MSFLLSLLIFLPLVGAPAAYLITRINRRGGVYFSLALAIVEFLIAAFLSWAVFSSPPLPGQYLYQERYAWLSFGYVGLTYFVGADGLSSPLLFVSALLTVLAIFG
jgi:NADH:ubiquinone oxidoreductase subunit 4 (subunit M)